LPQIKKQRPREFDFIAGLTINGRLERIRWFRRKLSRFSFEKLLSSSADDKRWKRGYEKKKKKGTSFIYIQKNILPWLVLGISFSVYRLVIVVVHDHSIRKEKRIYFYSLLVSIDWLIKFDHIYLSERFFKYSVYLFLQLIYKHHLMSCIYEKFIMQ
jgi:hypothetical protein